MFKPELLRLRPATAEDVRLVLQRRSPDVKLIDPNKDSNKEYTLCLEYGAVPIAISGLQLNSVYGHMGWGWCAVVDELPIPLTALAKMAITVCKAYSEVVDNLVATVDNGNGRTRRFAEWLGFEIDKELTNKYNLYRTDIMRYTRDNNSRDHTA